MQGFLLSANPHMPFLVGKASFDPYWYFWLTKLILRIILDLQSSSGILPVKILVILFYIVVSTKNFSI